MINFDTFFPSASSKGRVTDALLLETSAPPKAVVYFSDMMEGIYEKHNAHSDTARRFIAEAARLQHRCHYAFDLVAFGLVVATALWPIFVVASVMAGAPK